MTNITMQTKFTAKLAPKLFVTGTDTEIGKTLVSAALLHALGQQGWSCVGMKPVAAGAFLQDGVWVNEDVIALKAASNITLTAELDTLINPYLFQLAAAPHIAAELELRQIEISTIIACYEQLSQHAQALVVEGVGGFMVPLNAQQTSADMAHTLNLPVVLVVGMKLGCISQALLTAEAIRARGLTLAGWVANCPQGAMAYLQENIIALQARVHAPMLGCIPYLETANAAAAAAYLDLSQLQ